jgi:hypothetical protein
MSERTVPLEEGDGLFDDGRDPAQRVRGEVVAIEVAGGECRPPLGVGLLPSLVLEGLLGLALGAHAGLALLLLYLLLLLLQFLLVCVVGNLLG